MSPIKLRATRHEEFVGKKVSMLLSSNAKKTIRQMDSGLLTP